MKLKISDVKKIYKAPEGGGTPPPPGGKPPKNPKNTEDLRDPDLPPPPPPKPPKTPPEEGQPEQSPEDEENPTEQPDEGKDGQPSDNKPENQDKDESDEEGEDEIEGTDGIPSEPTDQDGRTREEILEILNKGSFDDELDDDQERPEVLEVPSDDELYKPRDMDQKALDLMERKKAEGKELKRRQEQEQEKQLGGTQSGTSGEQGLEDVEVYTPWQSILRKFLTPSTKKEPTYMRPDKRLFHRGIVMSTSRKVQKGKELDLVIAVDTSGSITKDVLRTFKSEILSIIKEYKQIRFKILFFTNKVYAEINVDTTKDNYKRTKENQKVKGVEYENITSADDAAEYLEKVMFYESGGTDIGSIKPYLDAAGINEIEGLLVFTDGFNNDPNISPRPQDYVKNPLKILFCINVGGTADIVKRYGMYYMINIGHTRKDKGK